jgi:hypothetical protein
VSDPAIPPFENTPPFDNRIAEPIGGPAQAPPPRLRRGLQITLALLIVVVCMELGLFLVIFPWTDYWTTNYFATFLPQYFWVWDNAYLKGAVSGLGVVNLFIGVSEILRLRRFAAH